ncbi:hypothetical protein [Mesorhizobium sp. B2-3-5]|uniref:hypothetical protein n=1 Tax=Mesorhizobium sp. B2-3-5 TaxID=2589958 RepID=UPI00112DB69C|nr:hypothetical protein [Mesorhizobium sp. B2-3-5]TPM32956.1 hypothetical protein FJ958_09385 [Mesorhizobium sp. B2-3-5]
MFLIIVEAVISLAYAYAAVKDANNGGDFLAKLADIQAQLDKISRQLEDIKDKLDDIEIELAKLPEKMRGIMDDANARVALGIAKSICQRLNDYMRPAYLQQSLPAMLTDLNELQNQIGAVKGAKGLAGLLLTSPLLSTWLAGRVAFEKASLEYTAGHVLDSPWKQSFMLDSSDEYKEAFERIQDAKDFYTNWVDPHSPYIEEPQNIMQYGIDYYFIKTAGGRYRLHDMFNARLQQWLVVDWYDVNLKRPGEALHAVDAFNLMKKNKAEQAAFDPVFDELQKNKASLFESFVEPAGFWDD